MENQPGVNFKSLEDEETSESESSCFENSSVSFLCESELECDKEVGVSKTLFLCSYPDCNKHYLQAAHLKRHVKTHHLEKKNTAEPQVLYKCGLADCQKRFQTVWGLTRHMRKLHCECHYCSQTFTSGEQLEKHLFLHTGKTAFKCKECGIGFFHLNLLNKHMRQTHRKRTYQCEVCAEKFDSINLFRKHNKVEHPPKFTCAFCHREFSRRMFLEDHIAANHDKSKQKTFICAECGKSFQYNRNLTAHIKKNHLKIRFKCPIENCERMLSTQQKLNEHIKLHERGPLKQKPKAKKSLAAKLSNVSHKEEKVLDKAIPEIQQIFIKTEH